MRIGGWWRSCKTLLVPQELTAPAALFERYRPVGAVVKSVCRIGLPLPIERFYQREALGLLAVSEARAVRAFVFVALSLFLSARLRR